MAFTILWSGLLFGFLNQEAEQFWILNAIFSCNLPLQLVAHRNAQGYLNAIAAELTHIPNHRKASFFLDCHTVFWIHSWAFPPQQGKEMTYGGRNLNWYLHNLRNTGLNSVSAEASCLPKNLPINLIEGASVCSVRWSRKYYFSFGMCSSIHVVLCMKYLPETLKHLANVTVRNFST